MSTQPRDNRSSASDWKCHGRFVQFSRPRYDTTEILDEDIDAALRDVDDELRDRAMDRLSGHRRVLFDTVVTAETNVAATDLRERYEARVSDPVSGRQFRRYVQKLEEYRFVDSEGENRWRTYRVVE